MAPAGDASRFPKVVQDNLSKKFEISVLSSHTKDKVLMEWKRLIDFYNMTKHRSSPDFVALPTGHLLSEIERRLPGRYIIFPKIRFVNDVINKSRNDGFVDATTLDVIEAALVLLRQDLRSVDYDSDVADFPELLDDKLPRSRPRPYNLLGAKTILNETPLRLGTDGTVETALGALTIHVPVLGNQLSELFDRIRRTPPAGWVITTSDDISDYIAHIAKQAGSDSSDIAPLIIDDLDNRQAALYVGSVGEVTLKTLERCIDTLNVLAEMDKRTFRVGLTRLGACIIIIIAAVEVGTNLDERFDKIGKPLIHIGDRLLNRLTEELLRDLDEPGCPLKPPQDEGEGTLQI